MYRALVWLITDFDFSVSHENDKGCHDFTRIFSVDMNKYEWNGYENDRGCHDSSRIFSVDMNKHKYE